MYCGWVCHILSREHNWRDNKCENLGESNSWEETSRLGQFPLVSYAVTMMIPTRVMPLDCMWSLIILSTTPFINPILQNEETELQGIMQLAQGHMASKRISKVCALNLCAILAPWRQEQCGVSLSPHFWNQTTHSGLKWVSWPKPLRSFVSKTKMMAAKGQWHQQIFFLQFVIWNLVFMSWDLHSPVYLQMNKTVGITVFRAEPQRGLEDSATCIISMFLGAK